jgi:hypothetical protein
VAIFGAVGQYTARVFGAPNASYSVGTFTVCVAPKASPSSCIQSASIAGNITAPSAAANPTVSTLSTDLTVVTAGSYTVNFADDLFPVALSAAPNLALFQGSAPVSLGIQNGAAINLNAGIYRLLAVAQADATAQAGLYGIAISGPAGVAPLLNGTFPVGKLSAPSQSTNPSTQTITLKVTDFAFPAALTGANALVTSGAAKLGTASAATPSSFSAPAGPLEVWSFVTAGTDAGTYEVDLSTASGNLLTSAAGVNNGSSLAFAFVTPALGAGSYQAAASDFQFPTALQGLKFAVAQNDAILATATVAGPLNFTAAAGPVVLLADATTPASGNGLFDVNVQTPGASPQLLFDKTQGVSVSGLFDSQTIILGTSGNFDVTLTDLKLPAQFQDLDLVVSSGGSILGKIYGGGTFTIPATPGSYQLTFIATPAAQQQYGLYAVQIVYSAPTVTLTASPTTVTTGATTTLTWMTANATACTAGGGSFIGSQATGSGSTAVIVSATTTYMLTCTGPGGTGSQSVTVTAAPAPASSAHGGSIDLGWVGFFGALVVVRIRQHRSGRARII